MADIGVKQTVQGQRGTIEAFIDGPHLVLQYVSGNGIQAQWPNGELELRLDASATRQLLGPAPIQQVPLSNEAQSPYQQVING